MSEAATTVVIRRRIQSANAFTNQRGPAKQSAYRKDRDAWMMLLRVWLRPCARPAKCHTRVEIHSFRNRILDDANLRGGCKGLVDNLKRLGLLYDDAPRFFHCDYEQHQVPRAEERTVVIIHPSTPVDEEPCTRTKAR